MGALGGDGRGRAVDALDAALADGCARSGVPGAQLGLLRAGERTVRCHGVLAVDGTAPVEPSTPFHAGSIVKAVAASLTLDAAARGELDLDAPASEQAPVAWDDSPRALLGHTSGRPNVLPDGDEPIEAFVARVAAMPRVHEPGRFSYCNAGWSVVDLLLREATGSGFEALAAERLLGPLGLAPRFGHPDGAAERHAVAGPGAAPERIPGWNAPAASAAGSRWWATADDLLTFAALHLRDGADLLAPGVAAVQRRRHADVPGRGFADGWAPGWATWDRGDHHAVGWAGYTGGHRSFLRLFPEQDAAVALLTNAAGPLLGGAGGSALLDDLLPGCLDALGVPRPAAVPDGPRRPADHLEGVYGPATLTADGPDAVALAAPPLGIGAPVRHVRVRGDTFEVDGSPPGGMPIAVDGEVLYLGPFALPRTG